MCILVLSQYATAYDEKSLMMSQNVRYMNDASQMTLAFDYWTPILSSIQMNPVFRCSVIRWLLYWTCWNLNPPLYMQDLSIGPRLKLQFCNNKLLL